MPGPPSLQPVLAFARALRSHNDRDWFLAHRAEYDTARACFETFVEAMIEALRAPEKLGHLSPADCIFRIHRDVRFSKDKTPYKPLMSAYVAPGGRKATRLGYYLHVEPGNSFVGGGLHQPEPAQIAAFRDAIVADARPFTRIISSAAFSKRFDRVRGEQLKTAPRGYPKDHPEIELLRLTSVTAMQPFTDDQVAAPGFLRATLASCEALKPFLTYLDRLG